MKKILSLMLAIIVTVTMFTACGKKDADQGEGKMMPAESQEKSPEGTPGDMKETKPEETPADNTEAKPEEKPAESSMTEAPKRVVAGTVAIAEMLDKLEFDDVVGVPQSRYPLPERFKGASDIGRPMEPDVEKVTALKPGLFISVNSLQEANEKKLADQGIKSLFVNTDSYEHVLETMTQLGTALGKEAEAEAFVSETRAKAEEIIKSAEGKESPKVLFLFGSPKSIMVGTKETFTGSLMEALKIHNIADDLELKGTFVPLNLENVVAANPDVILRLTHANPEESQKMLDKEFAENAIWKNMDAVKNGKVYDLDINIFSVSGNIKLVEALEALSKIILN